MKKLIESLRKDSGDYGKFVRGWFSRDEILSWDNHHKRIWEAANALESKPSRGEIEAAAIALHSEICPVAHEYDDGNEYCYYHPSVAEYDVEIALLAARSVRLGE